MRREKIMAGSKKDVNVQENPDALLAAGAVELVETQLDRVAGGGANTINTIQDVTVNKQKGAEKAAAAADALIRG
jgi:hypothetical protein